GHLDVLQWLKEEDLLTEKDLIVACRDAAEGGYLDVLKFLNEEGFVWEEDIAWHAARSGNLELLKWVLAQGRELHKGCTWLSSFTQYAVMSGHLAMMQWVVEEGCDLHEDAGLWSLKSGRVDVAQWVTA
ncbi:hypothetical protein JKP88DRAFT_129752, partial [Tribonema minus]